MPPSSAGSQRRLIACTRSIPLTLIAIAALAAPVVAQTLHWTRWPMPYPRSNHVVAFDPVEQRMMIFGGTAPGPDGDTNEAWGLRLFPFAKWEWLGYAGPLARSRACAVYDDPGGRMVMFGGEIDNVALSDTWGWQFSNNSWDGASFTGSRPQAGISYAAAFDALRRRMLMFGPLGFMDGPVYQLDLASNVWSTLATAGTPPQTAGSVLGYPVACDAVRDRLIVLGQGGVWQLTLADPATWTQLAPSGTPPPNNLGRLFYDGVRDRVLFTRNDGTVWALSMDPTPAWSSIAHPPLPTGTHVAQVAYDPERDRLLWFGGSVNDTWAFMLKTATWKLVEPGSPMPLRHWASAVAVPPWDAMVTFGGMFGNNATNTVMRFPLHGAGVFQGVTPAGSVPPALAGHSAIYDPVRNLMVVFGGYDGLYRNGTHTMSIGPTPTWTPWTPAGAPPSARWRTHAIYDPIRDRMVVFGGQNASTYFKDTWSLKFGSGWSQLSTGADLPAIRGSVVAYDSRRDHLIAIAEEFTQTRAWWMPLGGPYVWTAFPGSTFDVTPSSAVYDSVGDRVLLYGGSDPGETSAYNSLLQLSAATGAWNYASASGDGPFARYGHAIVRDPLRERFLIYGGTEGIGNGPIQTYGWLSPSVWVLTAPYTVGVNAPVPGDGVLAFRRAWLAAPDRIAFELAGAAAGPTRVEVYDVAGRRLGRVELPPGDGATRVASLTLAHAPAPGVYIVHARRGTRAASQRMAVLPR
jgi:hypothetical protein